MMDFPGLERPVREHRVPDYNQWRSFLSNIPKVGPHPFQLTEIADAEAVLPEHLVPMPARGE